MNGMMYYIGNINKLKYHLTVHNSLEVTHLNGIEIKTFPCPDH